MKLTVAELDGLVRESTAAAERATDAALMADCRLWVPEAYFYAELASKQAHAAVITADVQEPTTE